MNSAAKAQELGCKQADMKCLCANQNYMYGIRDCSTAVCGGEEAKKAIEYGISICGGAGVHITTGADGSATVSTICAVTRLVHANILNRRLVRMATAATAGLYVHIPS